MSMNRKAAVVLLIALAAAAGAAGGAPPPARAQTMAPYIWGISNQGETCGGYCYGSPNGGQYLCCGIYRPLR